MWIAHISYHCRGHWANLFINFHFSLVLFSFVLFKHLLQYLIHYLSFCSSISRNNGLFAHIHSINSDFFSSYDFTHLIKQIKWMSLFEISRLCICATGLYGTAICEQQSGHLRVYHVKNERNRNEREKRDRNFFVIVRKASEKLLLN